MSLLSRYLVRQNLFLLCVILLMGAGLYLLTDLFERMDNFLEDDIPLDIILTYFVIKLPMIVAQILPAVYLLALTVQLNILERSRELMALTAGGVSSSVLVRFVLIYGLVWAAAQFIFGQVLGVEGEKTATRIWQQDIQRKSDSIELKGLWFTEGDSIVHIESAWPARRMGEDIVMYILDQDHTSIDEILKAEAFSIQGETWTLENGERLVPAKYSATPFAELEVQLSQDLHAFQVVEGSGVKPSQLTLLELTESINRLERAGSNVERLRTAWHGKLSYAGSIIIMGLLALAVSRLTPSIYKAVISSLLIVFFYYSTNVFCASLGERGIVEPFIAGWFPDVFFGLIAAIILVVPSVRRVINR